MQSELMWVGGRPAGLDSERGPVGRPPDGCGCESLAAGGS